MKNRIRELLPEIEWIQDQELQNKVVDTYQDALTMGNWKAEDMDNIPFTLLIPDCPYSYLDHVRGVTRIAKAAMDEFNRIYAPQNSKFTLDNDTLIAGALLHDVGKLIEYVKDAKGNTVKSQMGKDLRHPFSGTFLALRNGCSSKIGHIIANHSAEGDGTLRSPEAVIVNKSDFINFETVKSFLGMK
ncbi:MAG: HD domain-containing protein [Clostridiaceae bacterium]|nr:HD domain-containing protein [Clostridiaceae bacterium]